MIYSSYQINEENKFEKIINSYDKISKKMRILVNDIENTIIKNGIINSEDIICQICKESIKMKIKEYKISLYDYINDHNVKNISFDQFEGKQIIDENEIKFGVCINNKNKDLNKIFYKSNEYKMNLCPICKSIHDVSHNLFLFMNNEGRLINNNW